MTDDQCSKSEHPAEDEPKADEAMADPVDFDVFALRSFKFTVEGETRKVGEAIGYWSDRKARVWRPVAYSNADGWLDGTCEAVCYARGYRSWGGDPVKPPHPAPDERCGCGVYGSLSYADLMKQFRDYTRHLVAVIAAEGTTIIGSRGLRTQFARVVAYWADPTPSGRTGREPSFREVAALQFKEAQEFDAPHDMCEAYGLPLLPAPDVRTESEQPRFAGRWWA